PSRLQAGADTRAAVPHEERDRVSLDPAGQLDRAVAALVGVHDDVGAGLADGDLEVGEERTVPAHRVGDAAERLAGHGHALRPGGEGEREVSRAGQLRHGPAGFGDNPELCTWSRFSWVHGRWADRAAATIVADRPRENVALGAWQPRDARWSTLGTGFETAAHRGILARCVRRPPASRLAPEPARPFGGACLTRLPPSLIANTRSS